MTPMINTDDLCDAQEVAGLVGLRHPNSVHTYLRRYPDMPRPVIDLGPGRSRLWLRPHVEAWLAGRFSSAGPAASGGASAGAPARAAGGSADGAAARAAGGSAADSASAGAAAVTAPAPALGGTRALRVVR